MAKKKPVKRKKIKAGFSPKPAKRVKKTFVPTRDQPMASPSPSPRTPTP